MSRRPILASVHPDNCCPSCGAPSGALARLVDLESEIQLLQSKNSSTADRLSYCEDQLRRLRSTSTSTAPTSPSFSDRTSGTRITSFLSTTLRRGGPPSPPPDCSPAELAKERKLRLKAEEQLQQVTAELEDLSASLFQTANEMVAEERKMRSKLEEKMNMLEQREKEKEGRLGMLERAVDTISRVRVLLNGAGEDAGPQEAETVEVKKGADKQ